MAYIPNEWQDQIVQRPKTYQITSNDDGSVTLVDSFGLVTELGTPVNADHMNYIENGISGCAIRKYSTNEVFIKGEWVKGELDSKQVICESLIDDNKNNPLTDTTKWKKVEFGGSGSDLPLFTALAFDHILEGNDAIGWALQGSLITNVYTDAVNKIKELYSSGSETNYRGISCKKSKDGRYIADITQKDTIDNLFTTTGIADFYILDSSNNQFYLPRSRWFAQFTPDTNLVNNFNEAGLPDIEGTATARSFTDAGTFSTTGAFYDAGTSGFDISQHNSGGRSSILGFKASNFNSLYSNSETVQPASSNKLLYYKVGNTIVNESSIDIGNVLSELQQKANKDLSNVDTYSIQQMLIPDYSTGLSITNGHTCAYPCYLRVTGAHEGATHTVNINGVKIGESNAELWGIKAFNHMNVFAYCDKGDVITFDGSPEIRIFKLKGAK